MINSVALSQPAFGFFKIGKRRHPQADSSGDTVQLTTNADILAALNKSARVNDSGELVLNYQSPNIIEREKAVGILASLTSLDGPVKDFKDKSAKPLYREVTSNTDWGFTVSYSTQPQQQFDGAFWDGWKTVTKLTI
jgi:hypothetical protein